MGSSVWLPYILLNYHMQWTCFLIPCWYNCHPPTEESLWRLQALLLSSALRRAISIIGAARDLANASITMEDCGSVRIAVPIDMKKLSTQLVSDQDLTTKKREVKSTEREEGEPKGSSRTKHILTKTTNEPVGARTVLYQSISTYRGRQIPSPGGAPSEA